MCILLCACASEHQIGDLDSNSDEQSDIDIRPESWWQDAPGVDERCGDGEVDPGEECDDGNRMNGDGCDWLCRSGDGETPDPTPDPDVPPITTVGPPVPVVSGDEVVANNNAMDLECSGEQYSLMYFHIGDDYEQLMSFRRFSLTGEELINEYEVMTDDSNWSITVDHTWTGSEYGVFYGNRNLGGIVFVRIGETGKRLSDPRLIVEHPDARHHNVAWTGSSYGLSWLEMPLPAPLDCDWTPMPARFSMFSPLGDDILAESTEVHWRATSWPRIDFCSDGAFRMSLSALVDTECHHPMHEHTLLMDGTLLESTSIGEGFSADVACGDDGYAILFDHGRQDGESTGREGLYLARFVDAGVLLEAPYRIQLARASYAGVRIEHDELGYVVLWGGSSASMEIGLHIARLDRAGRLVNEIYVWDGGSDPVGIRQYDLASVGDDEYAVAWSIGETIYWQVFR